MQRPQGIRAAAGWAIAEGCATALAAGVAQVAIVIAHDMLRLVPLTTALVGTMVFALVRLVSREFLPTSPRPFAESALSQSVCFVAAAAGYFGALALAATLVGAARGFYCEPAVPWSLTVALFGGFGMGLLLALVHRRKLHGLLDPAVHLAFFWIMPFYGYFQGSLLLAQGLFLGCDGRSWPSVIVAAVGTTIATCLGHRVAIWLHGR